MERFRGFGQPPGAPQHVGDFGGELAHLKQRMDGMSAAMRRGDERASEILQHLEDLSTVLKAIQVNRIGDPLASAGPPYEGVVRIEEVPGRRVPFDALVEIPIPANSTETAQGSITISQTGPFVATARAAIFLSELQGQFLDPVDQSTATFVGRSNGRFRPTHSAQDFNDAFLPNDVVRLVAFPGTGAPSYSSPASHAPYRTMEFDGRILLRNQGSGYPRSNIPVPTAFWTQQINSPWHLGALDFFARSEIIEFEVTPSHVNNPGAGNIQALGVGGVYPFLQAQFDHHEGIDDTENLVVVPGDPDPVTRVPAGRLIILLHGYRIIQPPGVVTDLKGL